MSVFFLMIRRPPSSALFPYTTSSDLGRAGWGEMDWRVFAENLDWNGNYPLSFDGSVARVETTHKTGNGAPVVRLGSLEKRSEEHTSELQSRQYLVCRLLLEKKNQPS